MGSGRVKFRESEELQMLTATRQSGGERSVSTILYLVAIQVDSMSSRRHAAMKTLLVMLLPASRLAAM